MPSVISRDGTTIAYDMIGGGPAVILVAGAFSYRKYPASVQLADLLAQHFTVFNYDRRGRGYPCSQSGGKWPGYQQTGVAGTAVVRQCH
jgi:hypothetical protein